MTLEKLTVAPYTVGERLEHLATYLVFTAMGETRRLRKEHIPGFLNQVRYDVKWIQDAVASTQYEREQDRFMQHILKEYQKRYCPCAFYPLFSDSQKFEFACLRVSIDDAIATLDEGYIYNDRKK